MKINFQSDVHIEFRADDFSVFDINNDNNADVLILAGDIVPVRLLPDVLPFFDNVARQFPIVIYIPGNHEYYHGDIRTTDIKIRDILGSRYTLKNVIFLQNQWIALDTQTILFGSTLWTDMNKENHGSMFAIQKGLNDYRLIVDSDDCDSKGNPRRLRPRTTINKHHESVAELKKMLHIIDNDPDFKNAKVIVAGHHAPSYLSIAPKYKHDFDINGAYCSDLSDIMLDNPRIKLWIHGHVHNHFDYMIGETRVISNPRGYFGYNENPLFNPNLQVEI